MNTLDTDQEKDQKLQKLSHLFGMCDKDKLGATLMSEI